MPDLLPELVVAESSGSGRVLPLSDGSPGRTTGGVCGWAPALRLQWVNRGAGHA
jgi:hypothetical protein